MTGRRALVITSPGSIGLQDAPDLVPGPGEVVAHRFPLEAYDQAYQVLRAGSGPRGKVMLEVGTP